MVIWLVTEPVSGKASQLQVTYVIDGTSVTCAWAFPHVCPRFQMHYSAQGLAPKELLINVDGVSELMPNSTQTAQLNTSQSVQLVLENQYPTRAVVVLRPRTILYS